MIFEYIYRNKNINLIANFIRVYHHNKTNLIFEIVPVSDQGGGVGGVNYAEHSDGTDLNYKFYNLRGDVIMSLDSNRNKTSST